MKATKLAINSRHREHPGVIASLADFEWTANEALVAAERAFASDAQAGTPFARADGRGNRVALPAETVATVERLLERQALIRRADFVLPGTVGVTGLGPQINSYQLISLIILFPTSVRKLCLRKAN